MKQIFYLVSFVLACMLLKPEGVQAQYTAKAYNEIANKSLSQGDLKKAIDYYNRAIRLKPYSGIYFRNRANAYFTSGDYAAAIRDYTKAIRYYRHDADKAAQLYYQRGLCHYIRRGYTDAVADFSSSIAIRPRIGDAYYFRGKILNMVFRKPHQASRDFETVLQMDSRSIHAAFAQFFLGNPYRAETIMNGLLSRPRHEIGDDYANLHYNMAGLMALMGKNNDAFTHLEIAFSNGFREFEWMRDDINFNRIRESRRFRDMLLHPERFAKPSWDNPSYDKPVTRDEPRYDPDRPSAPASLVINDLTFNDDDENNRIDAKEQTYISFNLVNEGMGEARNLELTVTERLGVRGIGYTRTQSLGNLGPGEAKHIVIQVNGDREIETGEADFRIVILEENGFDAPIRHISIPTQEYRMPELVIADHHFTSEVGGRMRLGVPINLKLAVQNRGRGVAENVTLEMDIPENVFTAGDDRFEIGTLQPGESKVIDFEFFTNRRFSAMELPIQVTMRDAFSKSSKEETFTVSLNQELEVDSRVIIQGGPMEEVKIEDIRLRSNVDTNLPSTFMSNPNAVAVIIGNRDYENGDVPPVDFALQDAASMKKYLVDVFGFDPNNIIALTNATQADFNGTFGTDGNHRARLFNLVKAGQSDVFVYYSGHGAPDVAQKEGYFVPVDCDPSLVEFNGYSINTFYKNLSQIPYRSLMVVLDACFSGASDKGTLMPYTSLARIKSQTGILNDPNAVVFTSASGDQVSTWYPDQFHSLFTYYFLKGIQGYADTDKDKKLTIGELRAYLSEKVPYMARRLRNRMQTPEINGRDSIILLEY